MTFKTTMQKLKRWKLPAFLLLLLLTATGCWLFVPSFLITRLSEYTHEKTNGNYSLTIENMTGSLFPFSLTLQGIQLKPSFTAKADSGFNQNELLYNLKAAAIQVEDINLKLLLADKILSAGKVKVAVPEVKLAGEELLQVDSLSFSSEFVKTMWPLLGYIQKVEVGKIEFDEANFSFYSAAGDSNFISKAEKVAVDVNGFVTSREMAYHEDNAFNTDDILIRMHDFRNDMGDSLHFLTIDTLYYSLKTADIHVKGFNLQPYAFQPEENLFEVHVPEVYVKSRSITHFALSDSLTIGFLEFTNPDIKFFHKRQTNAMVLEEIDEFDLYSLIKNQFIKLEVDSFYLQGAHLEVYRQPDTQSYRQQFQSIDIRLVGFELDSTSWLNQQKLLHANDLEMHVKGYHLKLEDDEHHFNAGSIFASTFSNRLSVHDIQINPENQQHPTSRTEINITCEALNINEVNFLDLYHKRILPTSQIEVQRPKVHLVYNLEQEKRKKTQGAGLLYEVVTDYLQGVYASQVKVTEGKLNIRNNHHETLKGYFESNIEFYLSDFRLDSTSVRQSSNFFYASNFDLLFSDYNMRLLDDFHKLEVDTITISSQNNEIAISNLWFQPVIPKVDLQDMKQAGHAELFNVKVPKIKLKNVDLRNAFFNQQVDIADFSISNPEIYFENFRALKEDKEKQELSELYHLIFSYIEDINIRRFNITQGMLTWVNHTRKGRTTTFDNEFSVTLENFRLNQEELSKKRLLFSDNFDLTIKDQEFALSDDVHVLKGNEIRFSSSESRISIKNALLFPLLTSEKYDELATTWQVAIPEIKIEGFDFNKAYFSKEPEIEVLEISRPRFQVYTQSDEVKGLDLKAYSIPLPSLIESLKITEFKITNGEAITFKKEGMQHRAMANFFFSVSVPDLLLKNNPQQQLELSSGAFRFSASDFSVPLDNFHNLKIESIDFDRKNNAIDLVNLKVVPFLANHSGNRFSIVAPEIRFHNFDFNSALVENNFVFNRIEINRPQISITVNKKVQEDTLKFLQTLDLYPYVEHLVNSIQVNNLDINDAHLHFNWLQKQLFNNKLNLSFNGILLSDRQPAHNLLNSKEFIVSTTNLEAKSKNGMYAFTADSLIYSSARKRVSMVNIGITPLAEKRSFPLQTGLQTDVVDAEIDYLAFEGIDERRWLKENVLDSRALIIGPANVEIFRNKRFPFDNSQRPAWPQDLIMSINQPFVFDSVELLPSRIKYSELLSIFNEPGYIEFTGLSFNAGRLTNLEEEKRKNGLFQVDARARLMGKALLSARFTFDLNSPNYQHRVTGSLNPMSLTPLNALIMKTAPVALESGMLTRLDFEVAFNEEFAKGEMNLAYDHLKIAILDYSGKEIQKDNFSSFLANHLKVNSEVRQEEHLQPVGIYFERDEKRSIIHFWWKSLYSGIAKVIGI